MYRDPEAASPGKRGPARAGAPRTGWGAPHRRAGWLQRLVAVSEPQPRAAVGWILTNCTPSYQGHPSPGGVGSSGKDSDSDPAVGTLLGWMPGAGFAVSPQGPPPHPQQPKDNVCGGARSCCPRGSRAVPSEVPPAPQHRCLGDVNVGGPRGKEDLWAKIVGTEERSVICGANCELRGLQGASGNLVQRQGIEASRGWGTAGAVKGRQGYLKRNLRG